MIKDVNDRYDDYIISFMFRQVLCIGVMNYLKMIYYDLFFVYEKMSYSSVK